MRLLTSCLLASTLAAALVAPVTAQEPTRLFITGVSVESLPFTQPNGSGWDMSTGPELAWVLYDANRQTLQRGQPKQDVTPASLPADWRLHYQVVEWDRVLLVGLVDEDGFTGNDFIGAISPFTVADLAGLGYPEVVRLSDEAGTISVRLELAWESGAAASAGTAVAVEQRTLPAAYVPVVRPGWFEGIGAGAFVFQRDATVPMHEGPEVPTRTALATGEAFFQSGAQIGVADLARRVVRPGVVRINQSATLTGTPESGEGHRRVALAAGDVLYKLEDAEGMTLLVVDGEPLWFELWPDGRAATLTKEADYEYWVRTLDVGENGAWILVEHDAVRPVNGGW